MTLIRRTLQAAQDVALGAVAPLGVRLAIQSGGCGLFGDLFIALNGMRFCEDRGIRGFVDWTKRSLYYDEGAGNVWPRLFEGSDGTGPALPYRAGSADFRRYPGLTTRESVHRMLLAHVKPRAEFARKVEALLAPVAGRKLLGVHLRLTDAARGEEARQVSPLDAYLAAAEAWMAEHDGAAIYLATDEDAALARFHAEFGDALIRQDCLRSADGTSLHGHYDAGAAVSGYVKASEVLVDALALARADHLIRGHSRVTCYSLCVNPTLSFTDLDLQTPATHRTPWLFETEG